MRSRRSGLASRRASRGTYRDAGFAKRNRVIAQDEQALIGAGLYG